MKLALRVLLLTVVIQGASFVFAEEIIISLLIIFTIALTTMALVMNRGDAAPSSPSSSPWDYSFETKGASTVAAPTRVETAV